MSYNRSFTILLLHCLLYLPFTGRTQHPFYYNLNDENGLPSNEVYQTLQDPFGHIWIGCDAGLFRYDGFRYEQFRNSAQNGRSISGLQLDRKGRIWCRNFNGQIYRVEADSLWMMFPLNNLSANSSFTLDEHCNAWLIDQENICCVNDKGKIISKKRLLLSGRQAKETTLDILYFDGHLYFTQQSSGQFRYNLKNNKTEKLFQEKNHRPVSQRSIFFEHEKQLYLFSEHTSTKNYTISAIHGNGIRQLQEFRTDEKNILIYLIRTMDNGTFWACTSNGVFNAIHSNSEMDGINMLFNGIKISNVFRDREGIYWFSSLDQGIFVVPSLEVKTLGITANGMNNQDISSFLSTGNELIAGDANGGVFRTDRTFGRIRYETFESEFKFRAVKKIIRYKNADYISHGPLSIIRKGKSATYSLHYLRDFCIVQDTLYFVNSEYCGYITLDDLHNNRVHKLRVLRQCGGRTIIYHPEERVFYINCNDGLYRLDHYKWLPVLTKGKKPVYCSDLTLHRNEIWVGTISQGILVLKGGNVIRSYHQENGLPENDIKLIRSSEKYVWACGNRALYRIDYKTGTIAIFYKLSGIIPTSVKAFTFLNGSVILATSRGLVCFPEEMEWKNAIRPTLRIRQLTVDRQPVSFANGIQLPYNNHDIVLELQSVSFRSQGDYFIYYRLKGFNNHWTPIPAINQSLQFSSLPSGRYTLEIRAVNENGVPGRIITIPVNVNVPMWQRWWFILVIILLAGGGFYLLFSYRFRYQQRQSEIREKLVISQLTALKAQMNPHFMYNALNSIQDLVIEKDIRNSNLYLSKFSLLMRRILDASGADRIALVDEIEILELYLELEKLRFGEEFSFSITTEPTISLYDTSLPSMILQPFVENAIKHGLLHRKGIKLLEIHFSMGTEELICRITDNGIGRKHSAKIRERQKQQHQSFATTATEKRIKLLNSLDNQHYRFDIIDLEEDGIAIGTQVLIRLPL